jgi:UDP-N-acetylmuramoyl-tripeptide--D-alanyl-D-alanine ligase
LRERTAATVLAFSVEGTPPGPGVWASDLVADPSGRYAFRLHAAGLPGAADDDAEVSLKVPGRHQVGNALAAATAALALGMDLPDVAAGLRRAGARSRWRMELHQRDDGVTVLNDAYNANPDSMAAAVGTLAELSDDRRRRTWAVLGDMLELGDEAERAHTDLGALVATAGIDRLVAVGAFADPMAAAARAGGLTDGAVRAFPDKAAAQAAVLAGLAPGDVVLVKASRGLALDTVAEAILAFGEAPA